MASIGRYFPRGAAPSASRHSLPDADGFEGEAPKQISTAPEPAAEEQHREHDQPAEDDLVPLAEVLDELIEHHQEDDPDGGPQQRAGAADDDVDHILERAPDGERARVDGDLHGGIECAGEAREAGGKDEDKLLVAEDIEAARSGEVLVLADRAQGAPHVATREPPGGKRRDHEEEENHDEEARIGDEGVVAERGPRDAGGAVRAAGEPLPAVEHDVEKLADGERADGEVVTAQAEQRIAQQISERAGDDDGAGQRGPEVELELLHREHAHHVGADADEAALAHGEVAHVAHEQPEGDDRDHRRARAHQQAQVVVVVDRRPEDAEEGEQDEPADHGPRAAVLKR